MLKSESDEVYIVCTCWLTFLMRPGFQNGATTPSMGATGTRSSRTNCPLWHTPFSSRRTYLDSYVLYSLGTPSSIRHRAYWRRKQTNHQVIILWLTIWTHMTDVGVKSLSMTLVNWRSTHQQDVLASMKVMEYKRYSVTSEFVQIQVCRCYASSRLHALRPCTEDFELWMTPTKVFMI